MEINHRIMYNTANKKIAIRFLLSFMVLVPVFAHTQVLVTDYQTDVQAEENALLELRSLANDKGLVMPKVALTATDLTAPLSAHIAGMTVYNTQTSGTAPTNVTPGFYYNNGSSWQRIGINKPTVGDVKHSAIATDHDGWYLLDGRAVSTLPVAAQTYAVGLGFTVNLPDATDRFLKAKTGAEVLGSAGGSASFSLTQANLPSFTFTGTMNAAGSHSHSYTDRGAGVGSSMEGGSDQTVADDTSASGTTSSAGAHTHTFSVPTGGTATPKLFKPPFLATNIFIYLGR